MGVKKLTKFVVELPSGKRVVNPPPYPFGDCRACSLIGWICGREGGGMKRRADPLSKFNCFLSEKFLN